MISEKLLMDIRFQEKLIANTAKHLNQQRIGTDMEKTLKTQHERLLNELSELKNQLPKKKAVKKRVKGKKA